MKRLVLGVLGLAGVATLVFAAGGGAKPVQQEATFRITVNASEFKYTFSRRSVPVGSTVIFKVVNKGKIAHDFKINGKKTISLKPGKSALLTTKFTKKGQFPYLCTLPGHAQAGMKGKFAVGTAPVSTPAPPPPPPTTTTPPPPSGPETLQGDPAAGRAIFVREACGSCHTLAAVPGATGGILNLDLRKPGQAAVRSAVQNGFAAGGNTMPAFTHLSQAELNNIAAFVYQATH